MLFAINLALVLYLVITKRLFGVRGGKEAYDARLRSESVLEAAEKAAAQRAQPALRHGNIRGLAGAGAATAPGPSTALASSAEPGEPTASSATGRPRPVDPANWLAAPAVA